VEVAIAGRVRRELAVRVEARDVALLVLRERIEDGLDLLFGAVTEDEATTDAGDRDDERLGADGRSGLVDHGAGRACTTDEAIEVRLHQLRAVALRDVAGEGERLLGLVDREERSNESLVVVLRRAEREGEEEAGAGEVLGLLTEVLLVELEGRLAVELEEHVALALGDDALRTELVPATLAAVADLDVIAVEADGGDHVRLDLVAESDPGLLEASAVPGETAGHDDRAIERAVHAANELGAVDVESFGQNEDALEAGLRRQLLRERFTGLL